MFRTIVVVLAVLGCVSALATVQPHALFTDNAVLQRGMPVPVWGTANDGEKVTVAMQGQSVSTVAKDGRWKVVLEPMEPGGPFTLRITGENAIEIKNVLVGEVWVCSGQSNMQFPLKEAQGGEEAALASSNPTLRLFRVSARGEDTPQDTVDSRWAPCAPETVAEFTAVGYFFGKDLREALGVPVGLIQSAVGGTPAEAWTARPILESQFPEILAAYEDALKVYPQKRELYLKAVDKAKKEYEDALRQGTPKRKNPPPQPMGPESNQRPSCLYNGMLHPLMPYAIRGAIWYQGEGNAGRAWQYRKLFPAMIKNWRDDWGQGDFPFLFVQLAPFRAIVTEPAESEWAELCEAQLLTSLNVPKTAMAVITDVGDEKDIHPKNKKPVGQRLALAARAVAYGEHIEYTGPLYASKKIKKDRVVLRFKNVGKGLVAKDGELKGFAVAGEDRKFRNATARIKGKDKVIVECADVPEPKDVRYGWANYPTGNLWSKGGLPTSPFRTDDFPMITMQPQK